MARKIQSLDLSTTTAGYYAAATITTPSTQTIHISGQPGTLTSTNQAPTDYASQVHLALLNLHKVIIAANASITDIAKLTLYIVDYSPTNRLHARPLQRFLGRHRPAVTLVPVPCLAVAGWLFEIEAVVAVNGLAAAPSSIPRAPATPTAESVDVVVIGAGLAGLSAARDILKAGLSCVVLEARDRVGGRTYSHQLTGGGVAELGAAWINDTNQNRMIGLARGLNLELIEQNTTGNAVLQDQDGSIKPFPYGELPPFPPSTKTHLATIRDMCESDCQLLSATHPASTPTHASLDALTFAAYLLSRGASPEALATARIWTRAMLGHEPEDISALFFLHYCRCGGGLMQMRSDRKGGGQHLRVRQGTQAFSTGLASALPVGTVRLNAPVGAVVQRGPGQVEVRGALGNVVRARKVVSAMPAAALGSVVFEPPLPNGKRLLLESYKYNFYLKAMVVFKKPFWVEKGFCGLGQSFLGPAAVIRDTSAPADEKWVLTYFLAGEAGKAWSLLGEKEREEKLIEQAAALWCEGRTEEVRKLFVEVVASDWLNEQWSGYGCPSPSLPPGVFDTVGHTLAEPVGDVHFVGTETSDVWKGYMEGAVRSGERGAAEVVDGLRRVVAKL